jgi:type IV secretion system protein TrbL
MTNPHHVLAAGCTHMQCRPTHRIDAIGLGDLNPLKWLGKGANLVVGDVWKAAMTALWSAGLWAIDLAFKIIDAFTTPDLSPGGPLAEVLPYTFAIGLMVATFMALIQLGIALYQRDGKSLARLLVGVVQFGAVWIGYLAIAAALVTAAAGLTKGLLQGLLHINAFSGFSNSASWPRKIDDTVVATVLGLCTVFLIFPAAIGYVLIMLVREAALMLLAATSPISAAGLLSEGTRSWLWKTLRWFIAALMISPLCALILGIGVKITHATIQGNGDKTAAAVGTAVVGCILILIGAICPLILFRLLAFVDPGTSSGAAMRASLAANGGLAGLLGGSAAAGGDGGAASSGAATMGDGQGRSEGEASAASTTQSRFSTLMGPLGQVMQTGATVLSSVGSKAASIGSDVLGSSGVGHQAPYYGNADYGDTPGGGRGVSGGAAAPTDGDDPRVVTETERLDLSTRHGDQPDDGGSDGGDTPPPPPPPPPIHHPPAPPAGGGGGGPSGPGGAGGGAAAGAGAAEVPVVPV